MFQVFSISRQMVCLLIPQRQVLPFIRLLNGNKPQCHIQQKSDCCAFQGHRCRFGSGFLPAKIQDHTYKGDQKSGNTPENASGILFCSRRHRRLIVLLGRLGRLSGLRGLLLRRILVGLTAVGTTVQGNLAFGAYGYHIRICSSTIGTLFHNDLSSFKSTVSQKKGWTARMISGCPICPLQNTTGTLDNVRFFPEESRKNFYSSMVMVLGSGAMDMAFAEGLELDADTRLLDSHWKASLNRFRSAFRTCPLLV